MYKIKSIEELNNNKNINKCFEIITGSQLSSKSCVGTNSRQMSGKSEVISKNSDSDHENEEEIYIEDIIEFDNLTTNNDYENKVRKHHKRKHSIEEILAKDSNNSFSEVLIYETKVNQIKRHKFSPQKRLNKLKAENVDHNFVIDEEEPETKLKCTVCTNASNKTKWSIASNSSHTIKKHLDSNIHLKSVRNLINDSILQNKETNVTNNHIIQFDFDLQLEYFDQDLKDFDIESFDFELNELFKVWMT